MQEFWEARKKDIKQVNTSRARQLAAKYFSMLCPARFTETMFPGMQLLPAQKKMLCSMSRARTAKWEYVHMPKRHGLNTLARLLTAYNAQAEGARL